ncbi:choline transporter Hnm1 [Histoplasma ohiense]|nr:choline transporter Hnm1 [Histoplasma ohiense (nom. inval.)]
MLFNPELEPQAWHMFVSYIICSWLYCCIVLFANKALPAISNAGMFLIIAGVFVTILVCAIMHHVTGRGYASNDFVWMDWENQTGYSSNGFVFVAGMLNGAYSVGNPDITSHAAEEIPRPSRNISKAVLAQMAVGFVTAITYMVALLYSIHDLPAVLDNKSTFPLAEIYRQATNSRGGALGVLIVVFLPTFITCIGCYITAGRTLWILSRDNATPFSDWLSHVSTTFHNPFNHFYLRLHRDGHGLHLCRLVDGIQCARRLLRAAFVTIIHCRDPAAPPERAIRVPAGLFLHAWLGWVPRQRRSVSIYDGVHCDILVPVCPACHSAGYELHFANHVETDDFRWGVVAV